MSATACRPCPSSSSAPARPASPPPRCWRSTASTACVLDRWHGVYPQPRAVHLDDEIYRIVARLGIADEFAAISRPALGLRLLDRSMQGAGRVPPRHRAAAATASRRPTCSTNRSSRRCCAPTSSATRTPNSAATSRSPMSTDDRPRPRARHVRRSHATAREHRVDADYVLGCDGANSIVRARIGAAMQDLKFEQRWLVVDVATDADLDQWDGVHQVCDPVRAGTYMRIGATRYRWEFRLLPGESADDFDSLQALQAADRAVDLARRRRRTRTGARHRVHVPRPDGRPVAAGKRLPARRRRAPHSAVHRPGHGRRHARRDEPGVEAGRRPCRRPSREPFWTPTSRNENHTPAT